MGKIMGLVKNNYIYHPQDNTCIMLIKSKGKSYEFIIDDHSFPGVSCRRWSLRAGKYLESRTGGQHLHLHRYLMGNKIPSGMEVDHINGNQFDNRIKNLRIVTHRENMFNMKSNKDTFSKFKGVYRNNSKKRNKSIYAQINTNGKKQTLGYFYTEKAAALAYDKKAIELFGEYAKLNFPIHE